MTLVADLPSSAKRATRLGESNNRAKRARRFVNMIDFQSVESSQDNPEKSYENREKAHWRCKLFLFCQFAPENGRHEGE
jgi:hypothetical protein